MPDIQMCPANLRECPMARNCYRNQLSGTVATEGRQAWGGIPERDRLYACPLYVPRHERFEAATKEVALYIALDALQYRAFHPLYRSDLAQLPYARGFMEGWDYATEAVRRTLGDGTSDMGTELRKFLSMPLDDGLDGENGSVGFYDGIRAVVLGSVSVLEEVQPGITWWSSLISDTNKKEAVH